MNNNSSSESIQCKYKLEACRYRSSESWVTINANVETTKGNEDQDTRRFCTVDDLRHGETYTFRVTAFISSNEGNGQDCDMCSEPSPPSNPLTIPLGDIPIKNVGSTSQTTLSSRRSSTSSGSGSCSGGGSLHVSA